LTGKLQVKDFSQLSEKVAMDLHRDLQSDMRTLRDEEFKLADIYMKIVALSGGAAITAIVNKGYSVGLAVGIGVVVLVFWLFLAFLIGRIIDNHRTYSLLGSWVMHLRARHASSAFSYSELDKFGSGKGAKKQILTLIYLALAVTVLVFGALYLSHSKLFTAQA
jgi:hypothetical protein